jgi:uncharacterized membrane protein
VFQIIPVNVAAVGDPEVTLEWDSGQEVQYADVRPGESGLTTFTGTVSADLPLGSAIQDVRIELRASSEHGWDTCITPETVILNPGNEEKSFSVTVQVPPETSTSVDAIITVWGTAWAFPGSDNSETEVPPIYGTIFVDQYCRFKIGSKQSFFDTEPGSEVQFDVFIRNEGNGQDQYQISIKNLDELEDDGFEVSIDREMIEVPEKGNGTVVVTVQTPEGGLGEFVNYKKEIEIGVLSKHDLEMKYQHDILVVRVRNDIILESDEFYNFVIVIIIVVLVIIIIWQYRKRKKELYDYLK